MVAAEPPETPATATRVGGCRPPGRDSTSVVARGRLPVDLGHSVPDPECGAVGRRGDPRKDHHREVVVERVGVGEVGERLPALPDEPLSERRHRLARVGVPRGHDTPATRRDPLEAHTPDREVRRVGADESVLPERGNAAHFDVRAEPTPNALDGEAVEPRRDRLEGRSADDRRAHVRAVHEPTFVVLLEGELRSEEVAEPRRRAAAVRRKRKLDGLARVRIDGQPPRLGVERRRELVDRSGALPVERVAVGVEQRELAVAAEGSTRPYGCRVDVDAVESFHRIGPEAFEPRHGYPSAGPGMVISVYTPAGGRWHPCCTRARR